MCIEQDIVWVVVLNKLNKLELAHDLYLLVSLVVEHPKPKIESPGYLGSIPRLRALLNFSLFLFPRPMKESYNNFDGWN